MSIKASKPSLVGLLQQDDDDEGGSLRGYDVSKARRTAVGREEKKGLESAPAAQAPATKTPVSDIPAEPAQIPQAGARPRYRSQGLTIYDSDEDLVDGFIAYLRKHRMRVGRKKGFSLFARAGLRALEDLRVRDPDAFEAALVQAIQDQR
jgi:hypothetical protein